MPFLFFSDRCHFRRATFLHQLFAVAQPLVLVLVAEVHLQQREVDPDAETRKPLDDTRSLRTPLEDSGSSCNR